MDLAPNSLMGVTSEVRLRIMQYVWPETTLRLRQVYGHRDGDKWFWFGRKIPISLLLTCKAIFREGFAVMVSAIMLECYCDFSCEKELRALGFFNLATYVRYLTCHRSLGIHPLTIGTLPNLRRLDLRVGVDVDDLLASDEEISELFDGTLDDSLEDLARQHLLSNANVSAILSDKTRRFEVFCGVNVLLEEEDNSDISWDWLVSSSIDSCYAEC
jgi:hypothetical protein